MNHACFESLQSLLRRRSGLMLGRDKLYLLETRLAALMKREGLRDLNCLATRLAEPSAQGLVQEVVEAMTTNETSFFRDDKPFCHVRAVLPTLAARQPGPVRIWSAAAASGQEAYSLAMIVEELRDQLAGRRVEILASDIALTPLAQARSGLYSQFEVQRGLPVQLLLKYFTREGAQWRIAERLRRQVDFREWNLLAGPAPLGKFDIIFCRYVLIYLDAATKTQVLESLVRQLNPGGFLYLGGTESALGLTDKIVPVESEHAIYCHAPVRSTDN